MVCTKRDNRHESGQPIWQIGSQAGPYTYQACHALAVQASSIAFRRHRPPTPRGAENRIGGWDV